MRILGSPFDDYTLHWRLFRCMSNENEVFANAIMNCSLYKNSNQTTVVDIGTGDGDIVQRMIKKTKNKKFVLVDPSEEYLSIAKLSTMGYEDRVEYVNTKLLEMPTRPNALYLAIHMIYLLSEEEIDLLLDLPNESFGLILIVDSPESVFSKLWKVCAPKYYKKCEYFHASLKKKHRYKTITQITSYVLSPYKYRIDDLTKRAMLSTMCYCDWSTLSSDQKRTAQSIISHNNNNEIITCISNLIEIPGNQRVK